MSVIMDALLSKEGNGTPKKPIEQKDGLYFSNDIYERSTIGRLASFFRRTLQISVAIVAFLFLAWGVWRLSSYRAKSTVVPVPVAAVVAAPHVKDGVELAADAQVLIRAEKFVEAVEVYKEALLIDPENPDIHNDLGLAYLKQNKFELSETYFLRAIALNPKCAPCMNNIGYLKTLSNSAIEAESYLLHATELDERYADPYFNLGVLYEKNGDGGSAISAYEAFLLRFGDENQPIYKSTQKHINKLLSEFAIE